MLESDAFFTFVPPDYFPSGCAACGEGIDTPIELRFRGRAFQFHIYCLLDPKAIAALLIPLMPAGVPV